MLTVEVFDAHEAEKEIDEFFHDENIHQMQN
jgi:hypothetical protein